jgi:hypothetical protein
MERAERLAQFLDVREKREASDSGLAIIAYSTPDLYPEGRARQSLARSLSWPIGIKLILACVILFLLAIATGQLPDKDWIERMEAPIEIRRKLSGMLAFLMANSIIKIY